MTNKIVRRRYLPIFLVAGLAVFNSAPTFTNSLRAEETAAPTDFNTVLISDVEVNGAVNRSPFIPESRTVRVEDDICYIDLSVIDATGMLRSIEMRIPSPPKIGKTYPVRTSVTPLNVQFYYMEEVEGDTNIWDSVKGTVVVDSIDGPTYRFRIINAGMKGGPITPTGQREDKFTLSFNGTATLK